LLRLENVTAGYRRLQILHNLDVEVNEGEVVALIGANGAGKTTTLRAISGLLHISGGRITFDGQRIDGQRPDRIVGRGLVHVPQERALFGPLNVMQNLQMGAYTRDRKEMSTSLDEVFALFPILDERRAQRADTMSGGQQQMLAIGRALMSRPRLLTLDEPSIGLAPNLVASVLEAVTRIRDAGVTVLIVEQNAAHTLKISDRAYVIESGAIAVTGKGPELIDDARVRTAYLGM
jgi:branched-chain amino acid transport system ATP-binding protein